MVLLSSRLGKRRQAAAHNAARRRRLSLLSDAALFRNLELAEGASADLIPVFPDNLTPVTFEGTATFNGAGAPNAALLDTGVVSILTRNDGLRIAAPPFLQDVSLNAGQRFRWNLAIRPGDAQVRFWIDSERRIAAQFGDAPFAWHAGGALAYADTARITVRSPLSSYYQQRPRHFGDANVILPGPPGTADILFRAAIATFLTGAFPFQENPTDTP